MKIFTEEETKTQLITPALQKAGWELENIRQERMIRYKKDFTDGKMDINTAKRQSPLRYDYCLEYTAGLPLAIIEAKAPHSCLGEGMGQAMAYAKLMSVPFAYASNGDGFLEYDSFTGLQKEIPLDAFPGPDELYSRYLAGHNIPHAAAPYISERFDLGQKTPRYYQQAAINAAAAAIAKGQRRALIVMATGTGKTFVAYQIAKRFFESFKKERAKEPRILYLADRNILIDQAMDEFKSFQGARHKIAKHHCDPAYQIYFALYQQFIGYKSQITIKDGKEHKEVITTRHFMDFSRNFFDMVMIDECHRGSADDMAAWREILDYFTDAIHIGMTATPKHKDGQNDNLDYFGSPVYSYELQRGINDGFLAPFKIFKYHINTDIDGYRVSVGEMDKDGEPLDPYYEPSEINRKIIIEKRTELVAKTISDFMKCTINEPTAKTIVFCDTEELALDMRTAISNQNPDLMQGHYDYAVRITASEEPKIKEINLQNFLSTREPYPAIATTSELLSTGVDTKMVKIIAIDKRLGSNEETLFKQIIGRGTRLNKGLENLGKTHFYILDFTNATRLFKPDEIDHEPISPKPTANNRGFKKVTTKPAKKPKKPAQKPVKIIGQSIVIIGQSEQVLNKDGYLISSNFIDFTRQNLRGKYANLGDFLAAWNSDEAKTKILIELENQGILIDELKARPDFKNIDEFDILCSIAYGTARLPRSERAKKANRILEDYEDKARAILAALLDKYATYGITEIENEAVYTGAPFSTDLNLDLYATIAAFGGIDGYKAAITSLKNSIYNPTI